MLIITLKKSNFRKPSWLLHQHQMERAERLGPLVFASTWTVESVWGKWSKRENFTTANQDLRREAVLKYSDRLTNSHWIERTWGVSACHKLILCNCLKASIHSMYTYSRRCIFRPKGHTSCKLGQNSKTEVLHKVASRLKGSQIGHYRIPIFGLLSSPSIYLSIQEKEVTKWREVYVTTFRVDLIFLNMYFYR